MILCCEYALRTAQYTTIFMLSACCCRMARLLQLDVEGTLASPEFSEPAQVTKRECQRRVLWSCFVFDSIAASGIQQDLYWDRVVPAVRLPCGEAEFLQRREGSAMYLGPSPSVLPSLDHPLELRACIVVMFQFRNHVLGCV